MSSSFSQLKWWKTYFTPNRYSYDQIPDQTGKVAIVTGANTGLGYATIVALAGHGAHVFLACRSKERALGAIERAKKEIKESYPHAASPKLEFLELDLNDITKCKKAADEFQSRNLPLHLLVNNSGIICPFQLSADGIEKQFAVNHMGHFVFTMALLDRLKASQPSRIVILSSLAHENITDGIDFETLNDESKLDNMARYARAKLANVLFAKALARRLAKERVYVNIAHPGYVTQTELNRDEGVYPGPVKWVLDLMFRLNGRPPKEGALTQLYGATSPEIENKDLRGRYFIPIANEIQPSKVARDEELQERLWRYSEDIARKHVKA
ncbi:hypothetical protein EMPS_07159 [Entomortierella parvispora]|uniref:NAD(P)-binding protein n=1 Tax=Entomortierella parvispora TaxID=205924 RepID=A0A9P3LXX2_9FUNG|nr:hypothetical protein EMPS_07159 [Entomortierella parvispora]